MIRYSAVVPVYNRPEEVDELLQSMVLQSLQFYEILIVEDGSDRKCDKIVTKYGEVLPVKYHYKENSGQGFSRNYGFAKASGDYYIVFDSDCILPNHYLETVDSFLNKHLLDAFGGPDRATDTFSSIQKAISYSMTSIITTGGIRGNKKHAGTFHPRSFNMGISAEVYTQTRGYKITRMGEDIELSIRIIQQGFKVGLIEEAFVYHKRRTSFWQFFKQLRFFGRARINVSRFYPDEIKLIHWFPAFFLIAESIWLFVTPLISIDLFYFGGILNILFSVFVFTEAAIKTSNLYVGILSIFTSYIQLLAYGTGLITEGVKKMLKG